MNAIGKLLISGSAVTVVHKDGTEETMQTLVARATSNVGATMEQYEAQGDQGNVRLGFTGGSQYFPRKGEATNVERSQLNYRKHKCATTIIDELKAAGVPDDHYSYVTAYWDDGQRSRKPAGWQPTCQIWLNKVRESARAGGSTSQVETLESLVTDAVTLNVPQDVIDSILTNSAYSDEIKLAILKGKVAKVRADQATPEQEVVSDDEDEPGDDEAVPQG